MPRSFDMSADYGGTVEQVHRTFSDEDYWLARLANSGADEATLASMQIGGDGSIDVVTVQVLRGDRLPPLVTQLHRGDLCIRRDERWSPVIDGVANVTVAGSIPNLPVGLTGTGVLAPVSGSGGARLTFRATVEVRVPLVGGRIENLIGSQLVELLIAEQRFTTTWIAENA
ncbi:DUF2505 domain-containing protein [Mycobacterium sp. SM1]|uniref:DUF2505 domain-containing protein n=1 Tax=Mycobacterium sp. SM1 TaxID=2816243 RepID=UPI001BCE0C50|nr:DUF2505 domain-containing protein [Mycobacterium sp. SM1]MBS4728550.1 DUF2505 domain-containing protein [Mycobacterium sp. SM1]